MNKLKESVACAEIKYLDDKNEIKNLNIDLKVYSFKKEEKFEYHFYPESNSLGYKINVLQDGKYKNRKVNNWKKMENYLNFTFTSENNDSDKENIPPCMNSPMDTSNDDNKPSTSHCYNINSSTLLKKEYEESKEEADSKIDSDDSEYERMTIDEKSDASGLSHPSYYDDEDSDEYTDDDIIEYLESSDETDEYFNDNQCLGVLIINMQHKIFREVLIDDKNKIILIYPEPNEFLKYTSLLFNYIYTHQF